MKYLVEHGVEPDRIRLSQSAAFEPLTTRLESSWQDENNCVEVFLLTEVSSKSPGTTLSQASARTARTPHRSKSRSARSSLSRFR